MAAAGAGEKIWKLYGYFFNFDKEISPKPGTHRAYLILSLCFVLLPFFLEAKTKAQPEIRIAGHELPAMCMSKVLFNAECPGCGMTHAFVHLAHGDARESARWNRAGVVLYLFFIWQIVFRSFMLLRPESIASPAWMSAQKFVSITMLVILFGNWAAGLWLGANGS